MEKDSPAEKAHLQPGDKLVKIDGHPVTRFGGQSDEGIQWRILRSEGETIDIDYVRDGQPGIAKVVPEIPKTKWYQRSGLRQIGLGPQYTTLMAKILAGGPAEKAGLQVNDRIVGVNGRPIFSPDGILDAAESHPDGPILLDVRRGADSSKPTSLQLSYEIPGPSFGLILAASPAEEAGLKTGTASSPPMAAASAPRNNFARISAPARTSRWPWKSNAPSRKPPRKLRRFTKRRPSRSLRVCPPKAKRVRSPSRASASS
ncbi:MAG: PDZ domain-containing protein [Chthoniobacter sp.]